MTQAKYQNRTSPQGHRFLKKKKRSGSPVLRVVTLFAVILSVCITGKLLSPLVYGQGTVSRDISGGSGASILDYFDSHINNMRVDALDGLESVELPAKTYFLNDADLIAPEPNPDCWGTTDDPSSLQWLLDEAAEKLGITDTVFSVDTVLMEGTKVTYYLDDTILCLTWKQIISNSVFTISEVKIADASQFRRFLSDGTYGSEKRYYPSEMAITVNAVTASSGDFYNFRSLGVNVYLGKVQNVKKYTDTCFIDDKGDLLFAKAGEFPDTASAQAFVDENNIRFSLSFGPILVVDGENVVPTDDYILGEINGHYARMALCQMDERHYLLVASNPEGAYTGALTSASFADQLIGLGVDKAFALDGGQTAAIITNDTLINRPTYGVQRQISDIIYFATAIPDGE